jgi:membrane protease YdiL (CAAX protease family)
MADTKAGREKDSMTLRTLVPFLALAFGLTWGIAALLILFGEQVEAIFGPLGYTNPLFILAVHAAGFAGIFLVWKHHGLKGLGRFFQRLTLVRMGAGWWLLLIVGIPAAFYLGTVLKGNFGEPFPFSPWQGVIPALVIALLIGPVEEFGWRGVALPLLQRRFTPFWASLVLGVIWAFWHIPAFFLSGAPQSNWSFPAFFLGVVALSVLITPMFNAARGSLLIPVLFHFQTNGPAWPDAQPWDTLVFCLMAAIVVVLNRKSLFTRENAVTEVLMPEN